MSEPKERPILFSGPMVRALLAGRKTQTRRVVKPQPRLFVTSVYRPFPQTDPGNWQGFCDGDGRIHWYGRCPYGVRGDRLWVKETWRPSESLQSWDVDVRYAADGAERTVKDGEFGERDWTMPKAATRGNVSPLHMPRWASRLTLAVTDIRVERLHAITETDAEAEGVREPSIGPIHMVSPERCGQIDREKAPALFLWEMLWRSINGADSWDANPWVWAVSFEVVR